MKILSHPIAQSPEPQARNSTSQNPRLILELYTCSPLTSVTTNLYVYACNSNPKPMRIYDLYDQTTTQYSLPFVDA